MKNQNDRFSPLEISKANFKEIGYRLIDTIADFYATIQERPVTAGETPGQIQAVLGSVSMPQNGTSAAELVDRAAKCFYPTLLLAISIA